LLKIKENDPEKRYLPLKQGLKRLRIEIFPTFLFKRVKQHLPLKQGFPAGIRLVED
jgi:hypothetical protein